MRSRVWMDALERVKWFLGAMDSVGAAGRRLEVLG